MYLVIDGHLADEAEIQAIAQTSEGRKRIQTIIKSTAVAFAVDNAHAFLLNELKILERRLTYEEIQSICNILWSCLFEHNQGELDQYVKECAERIEKEGFGMPKQGLVC